MDHSQFQESWLYQHGEVGFTVEAKHWTRKGYFSNDINSALTDIHHWNVIAYIYPHHSTFDKFDSDRIFQDECNKMPLHCGCSCFRRHYDKDGKCTCIEVASDYKHLGDNYETCDNKEDARQVFRDAEELVEYLKNAVASDGKSTFGE